MQSFIKKNAVTLTYGQLIVILVLSFFLFIYQPNNFYTTDTGCNVYDLNYVQQTYAAEQQDTSDKQEFHLGDVYECVRPGDSSDLAFWEDQLLTQLNESSELEFATFEDAVAGGHFNDNIFVATENFTIIPLSGADSVTWVCTEEVNCSWIKENLGSSTMLFFANGEPALARN